MTVQYNNIFNVPEHNLVNQRLTKAFFLRLPGITAAEKKLLNNSIDQMHILAQLLPAKSNIAAVVNDTESYEQVLYIVCTLANNQLETMAEKCILLIQKHIAHQMVLVVEDNTGFKINLCQKRINQNDRSKLTMESFYTTPALSHLYKKEHEEAFYWALNFNDLNKTNLKLLYNSFIQAIVQLKAAIHTGQFQLRSNARTQEDIDSLNNMEQLQQEIVSLTLKIKKATQLNEKVQLNVQIKQKRDEINQLKNKLTI